MDLAWLSGYSARLRRTWLRDQIPTEYLVFSIWWSSRRALYSHIITLSAVGYDMDSIHATVYLHGMETGQLLWTMNSAARYKINPPLCRISCYAFHQCSLWPMHFYNVIASVTFTGTYNITNLTLCMWHECLYVICIKYEPLCLQYKFVSLTACSLSVACCDTAHDIYVVYGLLSVSHCLGSLLLYLQHVFYSFLHSKDCACYV